LSWLTIVKIVVNASLGERLVGSSQDNSILVSGFVVVKSRLHTCSMMMTVRIIYVIRTGSNLKHSVVLYAINVVLMLVH